MTGSIQQLVIELRRRKVVRVLGAYTAAALAVIYSADAILPRFDAPEWTIQAVIVLAALGLFIAVGLAWAFDVTPEGVIRTSAAAPPMPSSAGPAPDRRAIAVLPFESMSGEDGSDYFCDGMSEEIINALAQLPELRVAGRTSAFAFKGRHADLREIGRQLNVGTVLEGSVRRVGDRVRITAQLVETADGYHLWSEKYDRELNDIFAVQEDIAIRITEHLAVKLGVGVSLPSRPRHPNNPQAYTHYLRGRHHMAGITSAGFRRAIGEFDAALVLEPEYALAHAALAECEVMQCALFDVPFEQGAGRAEPAARRALELDDRLAEAHAALGAVLTYYSVDWDGAERCFRRALELAPGSAQTHTWYGDLLVFTRRYEEGLREAQRARGIDPLSTLVLFNLLQNLVMVDRHDDVEREAEEIRRLFPGAPFVDFFLAMSAWRAGYAGEAFPLFERALDAMERTPVVMAFYAAACYTCGDRARGDVMFEELCRRAKTQYGSRGVVALVHVARGETPEAVALLRQARSGRENFFAQFRAALDLLPIEPDTELLEELTELGFR
jgi:adenylate cyclase